MWLGVLGPLRVRDGDAQISVSAGKQRVVLASLLVRAGQIVSVDRLADEVWDGEPPASAHVTVRNYIKRLRQRLGPAVGSRIITRDPGYLIELGEPELDLLRFVSLCQVGGKAMRSAAWLQASDVLSDALELWRGEPLTDIPSQTLHRNEAPRLEHLRMQAVEWRIEAGLHLGRHDELVPELQALVARYPLRERFHAQLILAYYHCGRQGEALATYRDARRLLVDELGIEPAPELQQLHEDVLAGRTPLTLSWRGGAKIAAVTGRTALSVPTQLPNAVRHFAGRRNELKTLAGLLNQAPGIPGAVVISAIGGTAGVGKSALAVYWAHQVAHHFPDGQLYVNLRGFGPDGAPAKPADAIRGFLDGLGVPAEQIPAGLDAQEGLYRSLLSGKRLLLLLDNARDVAQVRPLLPASPACLVVVTSRSRLAGLAASDGALLLDLDVLPAPEARELLERRIGAEPLATEPEAASELIDLCAGLPLALTIAAAHACARPGFPLATLAAEIRDAASSLDALESGDPATSVRAVFSWSYQALRWPAARMFRLLGVHPGPDITVPAAASLAGIPLEEARLALRELNRAYLVDEPAPGRFMFHDLLRAYAAEQAHASGNGPECAAAVNQLLDHYVHTAHAAACLLNPARDPLTLPLPAPGVRPEELASYGQALAWCQAEHRVLLAAAALAASSGFGRHSWQIAWALKDYLDRRGYWHDYVTTQRAALAAAQRLAEPAMQASAQRDLGHGYALLGCYEDAHAHLRLALNLFKQLGDDAGQARAHLGLGRVCEGQGCHVEALGHARRAAELFRCAGHRSGQAAALNAVGWCYAQLRDYERAVACCRQAVREHQRAGDPAGGASALDSLGYAHHHLGHHLHAVACYQRALELRRTLGNRYAEATVLAHLGDTWRAAGDLKEASRAWRQALAILDDLRHPDATRVRAELTRLESAQTDEGNDAAGP
jgi:DNA-binding SARP family transcriptional activator/tetratricopeptide (TPR) repeat protein